MKTLKKFKVVLVILVVSILAGCSEQITSPSEHVTNPGRSGDPKEKVSEIGDDLQINSFSTRLKLNPNREYTFSVSNTGLAKFTAINVDRFLNDISEDKVASDCGYLSIYGDKGTKYEISLSCKSNGFDVKQITIKNLSPKMVDLNVSLLGIKKKKNPNSEE